MEKCLTSKKLKQQKVKTFDLKAAKALGLAIRQARKSKGISQEKLAHRAKIEMAYVGRIERGEHTPTFTIILKIAHGLDTDASCLVANAELILQNQGS